MIKRTGEVVLAIIGLVFSVLMQAAIATIGFLMVNGSKANEGLTTYYNNYYQTMAKWDISKSEIPDADRVLDFVHTLSWVALSGGIITLILGIVGIFYIVNNKKPVLSVFLFLLAGIVSLVSTVLIGFFPALIFVVAAMLCFIRKPKSNYLHF
ncbi:DUF4064 domain-containing protein [Listeria sp. FSL L7-1485]|uniref:DUF4064 domain-containing protein n=1 Tax=Listeria immobilis TaxID=2713502 RepID=A0A7X0X6Z4_9LIST|nr:DUF4064 domain-containing protein [Listeria immobilis]MBC1488772.1 DUF4064 domain-containing protein [Listeria immobilis]MBC1535951.1 DUF4064 domain-containing protein [Listeria immobilis]